MSFFNTKSSRIGSSKSSIRVKGKTKKSTRSTHTSAKHGTINLKGKVKELAKVN